MTHAQWIAEINRRLRAHPRFAEGMRYVRADKRDDGSAGGASWYDPTRSDANKYVFLEISMQMCAEHPLIED